MPRFLICIAFLATSLFAQEKDTPAREPDPTKVAGAQPLSPAEAMAAIELPAGYHLELVASEPMIHEPAVIAWDGNGRMYVAEMRTYMQDIDGSGAHDPVSRVSLLEDTDGDGRMDKHSVFIDKLVLPRMILPLQDSILVRETNTLDLHEYRDTDGDGTADEKILVYKGGSRGGNLEHQPSGLDWNVDNFLYVTYTNKRYRYENGKVTAHAMPAGDGQWGITHGDWGQCYYSRAGGEVVATAFQQNMQYGKLDLPGQLAKGFNECWPIDDIPDVQGGTGRVRDDGSLNHFTGCCGQVVFRGDRLPRELYGNLFVPEPVGRLIRRAIVHDDRGTRVLTNAHEGSEFLRTKDANFRPINMYTAPDGTMYIVDMYRGIIQEGNWVRKGSYLRSVVQEYGLDRNVGRGRIYRLVHDDFKPGPKPRMLDESTAELVAHLAHPNGWWRDTAQKLIVLRGDRSVLPALRKVMTTHASALARNHAMWTLDGMHELTHRDVLARFIDSDARVRASAIRAGEQFLLGKQQAEFVAGFRAMADDPDAGVLLQVVRSAIYTELPARGRLVEGIVNAHEGNDAIAMTAKRYFDRLAKEKADAARRAEIAKANAALAASVTRGATIYKSLCFSCHGNNGEGMPVPGAEHTTLAPTLIGSPRVLGSKERVARIVLQGLMGPVDGKTYPGAMAAMASNDDEWIADALTYIRNSWGNEAELVSKQEVETVRSQMKRRRQPWTLSQLRRFDPPVKSRLSWKLTSNRSKGQLKHAIDGKPATRWTSNRPQQKGTWIQIELGEAAQVTGVSLSTAGSPGDFPANYEVRTSLDGKTWGEPIAVGKGSRADPIIRWEPLQARFVKITQTGKKQGLYWSIHDLKLFGEGHPLPK
jgi:mono/diheme cytochrome c family protein